MGIADVVRDLQAPAAGQPLSREAVAALEPQFAELEQQGRAELLDEGIDAARIAAHLAGG